PVMTNRWLPALLVMSACTCPPERLELRGFASAKAYQDAIKSCEAYGDCDPLCFAVFQLGDGATVDRCRLTQVSDLGANVLAQVTYTNTCAAEGDFVIDDDGYVIDDGGGFDPTTGGYEGGSGDCSGYCTGSDDGSGGYDDGSGGYDDGSDTGD